MKTTQMSSTNDAPNVDYNNFQPNSPILSKREQRLDKAIPYFSSKMLCIQIIITCIFSGIELSYGIRYRNQCPMQPLIDTFLIVHGATKLGWVLLNILAFINAKVIYGIMEKKTLARQLMIPNLFFQLLFLLWFIAWFIAGNIWVFSNKNIQQSTNTASTSTYCQGTLYQAAFGLIISTYIVLGIVIIMTIKRRVIGKKIKTAVGSDSNNNGQPTDRF
jgi:hypothetical protein